MLDSLLAHRVAGLAQLGEVRSDHLLYLPPNFKPIKLGFSKLKIYLRTAQTHTREALKSIIQSDTKQISEQDSKDLFDYYGHKTH